MFEWVNEVTFPSQKIEPLNGTQLQCLYLQVELPRKQCKSSVYNQMIDKFI